MTPHDRNTERRSFERRLSDDEIEKVLCTAKDLFPKEQKFIESAPKRFWGLGLSLSAILGVTTLLNMFYMQPLKDEMEEIESRMSSIDQSVRQHHEESAKTYVLKSDYDADMSRVLNELGELKGMMLHIGQTKR